MLWGLYAVCCVNIEKRSRYGRGLYMERYRHRFTHSLWYQFVGHFHFSFPNASSMSINGPNIQIFFQPTAWTDVFLFQFGPIPVCVTFPAINLGPRLVMARNVLNKLFVYLSLDDCCWSFYWQWHCGYWPTALMAFYRKRGLRSLSIN